jgi:hypothetical protein
MPCSRSSQLSLAFVHIADARASCHGGCGWRYVSSDEMKGVQAGVRAGKDSKQSYSEPNPYPPNHTAIACHLRTSAASSTKLGSIQSTKMGFKYPLSALLDGTRCGRSLKGESLCARVLWVVYVTRALY